MPAECRLLSLLLVPGICYCFTCVVVMVKATLVGGEKYESESLPYVLVSTFPPFTFFKTP